MLVVSSLALAVLLTGCHDEDKHVNKTVITQSQPKPKPKPKPKPFIFVINAKSSYVQSNGGNRYALSIPVASIKQIIAYSPTNKIALFT